MVGPVEVYDSDGIDLGPADLATTSTLFDLGIPTNEIGFPIVSSSPSPSPLDMSTSLDLSARVDLAIRSDLSRPPDLSLPSLPPFPSIPPGVACGNAVDPPAVTGKSIPVASGGDLQAALNSAVPGDEIVLAAGATFSGSFRLPKKTGDAWITIRSSTAAAQLPSPGTRITPAFAARLAKIVSGSQNPALSADPGAHHYRFFAVEIGGSPNHYGYAVVALGSSLETNPANTPHHLTFDRVWVHGSATYGAKQGILLNGATVTVVNSYISDVKGVGQEAQALIGLNGPGPFTILNNYVEGAGQNLMFGGADPAIPNLVPSDITIRYNDFYKPLTWKVNDPSYAGTHWRVKNMLELKNARRVVIDGNSFENCWADAQSGEVALFTVRNQDGTAPWSTVEDVRFTNNLVRHTGGGIAILGHDDNQPSQLSKDYLIRNNLFYDLGGATWGGWGRFLTINSGPDLPGPSNVTVDHNTCMQAADIVAGVSSSGNAVNHPNFVFTHNITPHAGKGVWAPSYATGDATLAAHFSDAMFTNNVLIGGPAQSYSAHPGNSFPATLADVKFVNAPAADYRLAADSSFHGFGVDVAPLDAAGACRLVAIP
jgi:hypothetical protein